MQPIEWLTRWKELKFSGSTRLRSIISTWSFSLYMQFAGLGLSPKPRRSTANNLQFRMADSGNTVSVQTEDDDVNPCMKMASSVLVSWSFSLCIPSASAYIYLQPLVLLTRQIKILLSSMATFVCTREAWTDHLGA